MWEKNSNFAVPNYGINNRQNIVNFKHFKV